MIPDNFKHVWQEGLKSNDYNMKLCGSGGGGFLLGFTTDLDKAHASFDSKDIEIVTVYKSSRD
jgi:mevalonate kinase